MRDNRSGESGGENAQEQVVDVSSTGTAGEPVAVGVSDHAEEGEADVEELGGGVSERGSGAHRGGAVRSDVSPDMGRPNRAVQTVLGVLVLKEMFDLTDMEALEELEFNLLWHHALRLEMEEAHLAQKTLHNFRVRLMELYRLLHPTRLNHRQLYSGL